MSWWASSPWRALLIGKACQRIDGADGREQETLDKHLFFCLVRCLTLLLGESEFSSWGLPSRLEDASLSY